MKLFIVGRRAAGITRTAAHDHLLHVHGPMVVMAPADAGPRPSPYAQNHVRDGMYPADVLALPREIDLVTEINFPDRAQMQAALGSAYYQEKLAPDEPAFVDTQSVVRLPVAETRQIDGQRGAFKILVLALNGWDAQELIDLFGDAANNRLHCIHWLVPGASCCTTLLEGWTDSIDDAVAWAGSLPKSGAVILAAAEFTEASIRSDSASADHGSFGIQERGIG
jgi:hypothetical protein